MVDAECFSQVAPFAEPDDCMGCLARQESGSYERPVKRHRLAIQRGLDRAAPGGGLLGKRHPPQVAGHVVPIIVDPVERPAFRLRAKVGLGPVNEASRASVAVGPWLVHADATAAIVGPSSASWVCASFKHPAPRVEKGMLADKIRAPAFGRHDLSPGHSRRKLPGDRESTVLQASPSPARPL